MTALKPLAVLALTLSLAGCQSMALWTRTTVPADRPSTGKKAIGAQLTRICGAWLAISYDSTKDTAATVKEARANNAARKGFGCK